MTPLLAISDTVWLALIAALSPILLAWMQYKTGQKLNGIAQTGRDVHTLVNGSMGAQLKVAAVALRRVAKITLNPEDDKAANLAEAALANHMDKQAAVGRGSAP